jgi:hypothetical protein
MSIRYSRTAQRFWERLLRVSLKGMNVGAGATPRTSGEAWVLTNFIPPGGVIVDVGANVGEYARMALELCSDPTIYFIEPCPEARSQLQLLEPRISVYPIRP